ncbi:MAG: serine/threonine protein kinase [Saprospiraceae bacterium]|nr:serine/threonine protein kinase [Saprospiraceae bacterium]
MKKTDMMTIQSRHIGEYQLQHKIGQGSTADVWAASPGSNESPVALKVFSNAAHLNDEALALFETEFAKTKHLKHPNILSALHFIYEDKTPVLVFPKCDSCLEKELRERQMSALEKGEPLQKPFSDEEIFEIVFQVASGLEYLHDNGIIHNDIKPANVVFNVNSDKQNQYFIIDFGISVELKKISRQDIGVKLASGKTVVYAAPEKLDGINSEPKSDMFSLGMVIYELAGGKNKHILPGEIIKSGGSLTLPGRNDNEPIQKLMNKCLENNISQRLSAKQVKEWIETEKSKKQRNLFNKVKNMFLTLISKF